MLINFKCSKKEFPVIDMFLHQQEYDEKPEFANEMIQLNVENDAYRYEVHKENNKYYLVTK